MTIWHKKLLIFSVKIFSVIIFLIVTGLFLYYQYYFKKDNLIKYIPKNAVMYSTFRLNNESKENLIINKVVANLESEFNIPTIDFKALNDFVAYNAGFALIPDESSEKIKLNYLFVFNLKEINDSLDEYLMFINNSQYHYEIITHNNLDRNILIISNSLEVMKEVLEINDQGKSSLVSRVDIVYNLKRFDINSLAKIYLNLDYFYTNESKINDLYYKLFVKSFETDNIDELFFDMNSIDNKLIFQSLNHSKTKNNLLMENIPNNFKLNLSFNGLSEYLRKFETILQEIDTLESGKLAKNKQYIENTYNLDLYTDIINLFNNQAQIIIDTDDNYIIGIDLAKIHDYQAKIKKLEEIVIEYISINYPKEVEKMLPDYTYITQIIRNTDDLVFYREEIAKISLNAISYDGIEYAYFLDQNHLYFANTRENLINIIKNETLISLNDDIGCYNENLASFSTKVVLRPEIITKYFNFNEYLTNIVIATNKGDDFWLCLE